MLRKDWERLGEGKRTGGQRERPGKLRDASRAALPHKGKAAKLCAFVAIVIAVSRQMSWS